MKLLIRYLTVGLGNTIIHWLAFLMVTYLTSYGQAISNLVAFFVAINFSYFLNSYYTFNVKVSSFKYVIFVIFMGSVSLVIGYLSDYLRLQPIFTLVSFSFVSLICGFLFSKYIVFKRNKL